MVASNTPDFERPILRMGSIAFLVGMVIFLVSTILHPGREDPTNHPLVFAEYAEDELWVASHIGQFAGGMLAFAGGFYSSFPIAFTVRIRNHLSVSMDGTCGNNSCRKCPCSSSGCRWNCAQDSSRYLVCYCSFSFC